MGYNQAQVPLLQRAWVVEATVQARKILRAHGQGVRLHLNLENYVSLVLRKQVSRRMFQSQQWNQEVLRLLMPQNFYMPNSPRTPEMKIVNQHNIIFTATKFSRKSVSF